MPSLSHNDGIVDTDNSDDWSEMVSVIISHELGSVLEEIGFIDILESNSLQAKVRKTYLDWEFVLLHGGVDKEEQGLGQEALVLWVV